MSKVEELLTSARAALQAGDDLVARGYLRRAARLAPGRLDIWTELCQVTERPEDRAKCLERIADLDPTNVRARSELEQLRQEQEPIQERAVTEPTDTPQEPGDPQTSTDLLSTQTSGMRLDVTDEMRRQWADAVSAGRPLFCIDHPHRETVLRCNLCDAPVCTDCVVRTPVGFRCKECIKAQQDAFYNALWYDLPLAALVALALSVPAAVITSLAGWWFALIISPLAGGLIGGAIQRAVGGRRGRHNWWVVAVCIVLGAFVAWTVRPRALLTIGIFAFLATGAAVGTLRLGRRR
jgi:hypothetical protein